MLLQNYRPRSALVTKVTKIDKPRYPVVDAHNHLSLFDAHWMDRPVHELLDQLDQARIQTYVDLDGGWGEKILQSHLDKFKAAAPERFLVFAGVDWSTWPEHGNLFGEWAASRLKEQVRWGAQGLKIWKNLGLHVRDQQGQLVRVDDPRLDPLWATASELKLPVTIHVADPVAFFDPLDHTNERWEELQDNPDWHFLSPPHPPFLSILEALANLVQRHPTTTFIGAHVGCYSENLAWVSALLDRCPNFYVDTSARFGELGRQPYTARKFFIQYANRILFGSDFGADVEAYRLAYRILESDDEYFNYNASEIPSQGRWYVYGLFLPDEVLQQVYFRNAARVILQAG